MNHTPSSTEIATATTAAIEAKRIAGQASEARQLAKANYKSAKRAWKKARKADRKAAKLVTKAQHKVDRLHRRAAKAKARSKAKTARPSEPPPEPTPAHQEDLENGANTTEGTSPLPARNATEPGT